MRMAGHAHRSNTRCGRLHDDLVSEVQDTDAALEELPNPLHVRYWHWYTLCSSHLYRVRLHCGCPQLRCCTKKADGDVVSRSGQLVRSRVASSRMAHCGTTLLPHFAIPYHLCLALHSLKAWNLILTVGLAFRLVFSSCGYMMTSWRRASRRGCAWLDRFCRREAGIRAWISTGERGVVDHRESCVCVSNAIAPCPGSLVLSGCRLPVVYSTVPSPGFDTAHLTFPHPNGTASDRSHGRRTTVQSKLFGSIPTNGRSIARSSTTDQMLAHDCHMAVRVLASCLTRPSSL